MRDRRFVAKHRGGPLDLTQHRLLALWAVTCAERVLPLFEQCTSDDRPRVAIQTARAWAQGQVPVGAAQKAAVRAHAAAREVSKATAANKAATAAARASGHAVATAHMADHSLGGSIYALKAIKATGASIGAELSWQLAQLPSELRDLVTSALAHRLPNGLKRTID